MNIDAISMMSSNSKNLGVAASQTTMTTSSSSSSPSIACSTKKRKKKNKQKKKKSTISSAVVKKSISLKNPLMDRQEAFLKAIPDSVRTNFFSEECVSPSTRARLWEEQADLGEKLINQYAWATPDTRALNILNFFNPIVEIGSGSNAYWGKCMKQVGIDVECYEKFPNSGGKLSSNTPNKKRKTTSTNNNEIIQVKQGGPEALKHANNKNRTLFLCYPDEDEQLSSFTAPLPNSMAEQCLQYYKGNYIIHVGELYGDSISLDSHQAPWGRSSSWKFQLELQQSFHCLLKCRLRSSWLHVRDSISVWKRTTMICAIVFADDDSGGDEEEVRYKHIPLEERLPFDVAAPCMQHLLSTEL